jgi:hypothetical protein
MKRPGEVTRAQADSVRHLSKSNRAVEVRFKQLKRSIELPPRQRSRNLCCIRCRDHGFNPQ